MQVVFACGKENRFVPLFLNLFLFLLIMLPLFLSASVDHVWKYLLPSGFYSQDDFFARHY